MRTHLFALLALLATFSVTKHAAAAEQSAGGINVIVLDAGHGGTDPGAHYAGVYEKDITLKVVLRLGKLIEQGMPGVKVVYTRTTDKALAATKQDDLQARADIANKAGGDLFLSVHVNASHFTAARGAETLVMGESTKEQQYNEDALYENNRDDLIDMSDERTAAIVRAYIQNLQFTYGEYSLAIANCIQKNYEASGRRTRGVKPQLLRVLYATDMPGVLTEIGFLSNPKEAAYLKSEKGLDEIARSLFRSVKEYSARLSQLRGEIAGSGQPSGDRTSRPARASGSQIRTDRPAGTPDTTEADRHTGSDHHPCIETGRETGFGTDANQPAATAATCLHNGRSRPLCGATESLAGRNSVAIGAVQGLSQQRETTPRNWSLSL